MSESSDSEPDGWPRNLRRLSPLKVVWNEKIHTFLQYGVLNRRGLYASSGGDFLWFFTKEDRKAAWVISYAEDVFKYIEEGAEPSRIVSSRSRVYVPTNEMKWIAPKGKKVSKLVISEDNNFVYDIGTISGSMDTDINGRYFICGPDMYWNGKYYLWQPYDKGN